MKKLFFLLFLFACGETTEDGRLVEYTINKGSHNASPIEYKRVRGEKIYKLKINFRKPQYQILNANGSLSSDQADWNKATGFSDCNNFDAFRGKGAMLGWRWNQSLGVIELAAYVHNQGDKSRRVIAFTATANVNTWYEFSIKAGEKNKTYTYKFNGETIVMSGKNGRGCELEAISGRLITPYFGGNRTAPNDILIDIEYLK